MCDCWTEDIWKCIHIISKISSIKDNQEKAAFCAMLMSINRIISCSYIETAVLDFVQHPDTDIMLYMTSNDRLFHWTILLRQYINRLVRIHKLKEEGTVYTEVPDRPTFTEVEQQYIPKMMTKNVWGHSIWKVMHSIALRAKLGENEFCPLYIQTSLKAFYTCISLLLPCDKCRKHAWEYYIKHPINAYLDTNLHAFEWTVLFHNDVTTRANQIDGTIKKTYTPLEALSFYVTTLPPNVNFSEKFLN